MRIPRLARDYPLLRHLLVDCSLSIDTAAPLASLSPRHARRIASQFGWPYNRPLHPHGDSARSIHLSHLSGVPTRAIAEAHRQTPHRITLLLSRKELP